MQTVRIVFLKEIREMLRDKRVLMGAFVAPIFLIVLMLALVGFVDDTVKKPKPPRIAVVKSSAPSAIEQSFLENPGMRTVPVASEAEGKSLVESGSVKALLQFSPGFEQSLSKGTAELFVTFDQDEPTSQIAVAIIEESVQAINKSTLEAVLQREGIPKEASEPIKVVRKPISKAEGLGSSMIVGLLPYLIVIWAFYGGFSIVADLVAGEKERGTIETLLISPAERSSIALGKFLALGCVCFVSALTSLVGTVLVGVLQLPFTKSLFPEGVHLSIGAILSILVTLISLVTLFAGILLSVSAASKNMREAQTYLTLVSFVVLMPAIFSQFIGFTDLGKQTWVAFTPILNSSIVIRESLLGKPDIVHLLLALGINLVLGLIGLRVVVSLFGKEQILGRI